VSTGRSIGSRLGRDVGDGILVQRHAFGTFDFGLTAEEEARAELLHRHATVVDMLFQGPFGQLAYETDLRSAIAERRKELGLTRDGDWDARTQWIDVARQAPVRAALDGDGRYQALWEESGIVGGSIGLGYNLTDFREWALAQTQFDAFPWLVKGLRAADFHAAKEHNQRVGFVSSQDPAGLDSRLENLRYAAAFGLRVLGLTYNQRNVVGGGCTDRFDVGLSEFGIKLVSRMNALGVIVDTAHSGRQTTLDSCAVSELPVIASHTSARALHHHDRAKDDSQLEAVAATGGVIGVCAVPAFLGRTRARGSKLTVQAILDHIDHITRVVGWQHVGVGTDWPLQMDRQSLDALINGLKDRGFRPEHGLSSALLDGFRDCRDFRNITRGLVARSYSDEQINGILGLNFLRVFDAVCG
jgi:membrane dipeptidase